MVKPMILRQCWQDVAPSPLFLTVTSETVMEITYTPHTPIIPVDPIARNDCQQIMTALTCQLNAWFSGHRQEFNLKLFPAPSPFQARLRQALLATTYGETLTYGVLATRLDRPGAARAVANGCRRNPLPILVPCHRIVGVNSLGGYAGETTPGPLLTMKQYLLDLEHNSQVTRA